MEGGIAWSDKKYDIREFVELFYDRLPLLARIEEVYEKDEHDIKPDTQSVCLVHSVHLQPRIVARAEQNDEQFITFPNSYPFKFHVLQTDGSISEPMTVKEILSNRKQNPKGTRIRMAHREQLSLSENVTCDVFGTLVIGGTYSEKYLLVIRLSPFEGISSSPLPVSDGFRLTVLPTYTPLVVTLPATGDGHLKNDLEKYQRDLEASVSAASYKENTEELLIFSHPPDDDEYEMVFPSTFITIADQQNKRKSSHFPESYVDHSEPSSGAKENEVSQQPLEITSRRFEEEVESTETTVPVNCSSPVQAEAIYEDVPRCYSPQSSETPGVQSNSDKDTDEHVYESYAEIPQSLLAEEVSDAPPLPVKHLVGRSSVKVWPEPDIDSGKINDSSDRLVRPTGNAVLWEPSPNRPSHSSGTREHVTIPRLPCRPFLKKEKPPKLVIASDKSSERMDENKTNKLPWYRFRPFRRRSTEKVDKMSMKGLRKFSDICPEKSPETLLASTELHQTLRKSSSYDVVGLSHVQNIINSRCETKGDSQTSLTTEATNSSLPVTDESTRNEIRSNHFLRTHNHTALHRRQVESKTTAEKDSIRLKDGPNEGPREEMISNRNFRPTYPPLLDAFQVRSKFDRDSGFSSEDFNPSLSLTSDSPINCCSRDRIVTFTSLADVPADLSSLTVSGVTNCLHLLNLSQYIHLFRDQDVDGDLLSCLDSDILMQDFGLKRFDAIKLSKFVRDGWRPRTERDNQVT